MASNDRAGETLLNQLTTASGQERRALLQQLKEKLTVEETLLLDALRHSSTDVQRTALKALHEHGSYIKQHRASILSAVQAILNRFVGNTNASSSTTLSAYTTASLALSTLSLALVGSSEDVQSTCKLLQACMAIGLKGLGKSQQNRRPITPGSAFTFSTSSQSVATTSIRKQPSSSSLKSVASSSWENESIVYISDSDTGYDNKSDSAIRKSGAERSLRQKSIACIDALSLHRGGAVVAHLPSLLSESEQGSAVLLDVVEKDDYSSNRVAACRACEKLFELGASSGAFAGAQESTRLGAFTSLASRIAMTIVQCRARLVQLLLQKQGPPAESVKEAALRCLATLIGTTHSAKLRYSHAKVVQPLALQLCASKEPAIAVRAYALLSMLHGEKLSAISSATASEKILEALSGTLIPSSVKVDAWNTLAGQQDKCEAKILDLALQHAHPSSNNEDVRQAVANFCKQQSNYVDAETLHPHLALLCTDPSAGVRSSAADCLGLLDAEGDRLATLTMDLDGTVRAAAIRAVGVAVQRLQKSISVTLIRQALRDSTFLVRNRASWSLANVCEVSSEFALLQECLRLKDDDERICINIVRAIGALTVNCTISKDQEPRLLESIVWLRDLLHTSKDPKLRWNICSSFVRIFNATQPAQLVLELDKEHNANIVAKLASIAACDKIFKTRLAACLAVQAVVRLAADEAARKNNAKILDEEHCAVIRRHFDDADAKIEQQLQSASFRERQLHVSPLRDAIKAVRLAIDSDPVGGSDSGNIISHRNTTSSV